jgi:hypothetical protein
MQNTCNLDLTAIHKRLAVIAVEICKLEAERQQLDILQRHLAMELWQRCNGFKLRSIAEYSDEDATNLIASIIKL